jgi:hypothetical protein
LPNLLCLTLILSRTNLAEPFFQSWLFWAMTLLLRKLVAMSSTKCTFNVGRLPPYLMAEAKAPRKVMKLTAYRATYIRFFYTGTKVTMDRTSTCTYEVGHACVCWDNGRRVGADKDRML